MPSSAVPHPPSNEQTPNQDNPRPKVRLDLADALQFFSQDGETELSPDRGDRLSQVMEYLRFFGPSAGRSHRCLLMVDDVQTIFSSGQLAGHYKDGYEDYRILWKQVGELSHNSCLLLNSWSAPREISSLAGENLPVRSIRLSGTPVYIFTRIFSTHFYFFVNPLYWTDALAALLLPHILHFPVLMLTLISCMPWDIAPNLAALGLG